MLNSALDIHPALDKLVDLDRHNQVTKTRLRRLKLTADEWKLLMQLRPVLSVGSTCLHVPRLKLNTHIAFP